MERDAEVRPDRQVASAKSSALPVVKPVVETQPIQPAPLSSNEFIVAPALQLVRSEAYVATSCHALQKDKEGRVHTAPQAKVNPLASMGSAVILAPVAAKIAFASAGPASDVPDSPMPHTRGDFSRISILICGVCAIVMIG